jgi:hypothetical protein
MQMIPKRKKLEHNSIAKYKYNSEDGKAVLKYSFQCRNDKSLEYLMTLKN